VRRRSRTGVTLVEIMVVIAIMTVSMSIFAQTLAASSRMDPIANETMLAAEGARVMLERMKAQPFADVFALYDADPTDDPGGPGSAPGSTFSIEGLAPATIGGTVGVIQFPVINGALREDAADERLGTPRDLNADGVIDAANHRPDYKILPIRVRVEWASQCGRAGRRSLEMYAMFSPL
jgi:prepilin-type N-terminal cleavage/methylation domain-containing protein